MRATTGRSRKGLVVVAGLAVFAALMTVVEGNPVIAIWYTAFVGAIALAVMAIWSRGARYALSGLIFGGLLGGGVVGVLVWNDATGTGWEGLVRAIAIMSGTSLGAIVGSTVGWLVSLRRRR